MHFSRYTNSTDNDLRYWGLDYPPLSGYQSWLCGILIQRFDPAAVALHSSRGYETIISKALMRWTVVISDLLVLIPAALSAATFFGQQQHGRVAILSTMLLNPAYLLTDHGHFQYNGISLGLTAGSMTAICAGYDMLGSLLFCLALNHKQMSLYFAPVFFVYLLAKSLRKPTTLSKAISIFRLGITVVITFSILWFPYIRDLNLLQTVINRIFPVKRGLFEDYVANFWCVSSMLVKWKRLFQASTLFKASTVLTIAAIIPSAVGQYKNQSPTNFLATLYICSMAFYQFSYQVHEKTIIFPLLPVTFLANQYPALVFHNHLVATYSMGPLLVKDELMFATLVVIAVFINCMYCLWKLQLFSLKPFGFCTNLMYVFMTLLAIVAYLYTPPDRFPYLWDAAVMVLSFPTFFVSFVYMHKLSSSL